MAKKKAKPKAGKAQAKATKKPATKKASTGRSSAKKSSRPVQKKAKGTRTAKTAGSSTRSRTAKGTTRSRKTKRPAAVPAGPQPVEVKGGQTTQDADQLREQIQTLAYLKWEEAGRPEGDGVQFWHAAEQEILARQRVDSDAPGA